MEKRICEGVADKLLDTKVSDIHIAEIATDLVDWELLAPGISLTRSEQKEIREDFEGRYNLQKRQALRVWRWKNGDKATYRQLIGVCCGQGNVDLAESIVKYLGPNQRPRSSQVLNDTFYRYLLDCYSVISHPSIKQWPSKAAHISIPQAYFDLILYDAPLNIPSSSLPVNESCFKAVTLHDVLTKSEAENRLLVYFEGIAGSGKSTLSWHTCREWGQKRILQHFDLLIHIELSNPKVKEATNLMDIIPYPDKELRQIIAMEIIDRKGEGICLLLDGLDEAPTPLLDFLLVDLIQGKPGVPQVPNLNFLLTSRPDSRVTERLESVTVDCSRARVIIKGFNRENLHQFLDQSLGVDTKMRMKLKEKCDINPRLEGLCSLPINAVIMSFLIHCIEDDGPATQTGLYEPFVSNFLVRHLDVRQTLEKRPFIECLLNDVPVEILDSFQKICSLAYHSSLEGKQLFTKRELGQNDVDIDNTLGLLQVHPQITMCGTERYYKFFHLSLQEFLAAVHLSKHDQLSSIKEVLSKIPQRQVLPFYAGLTSLSNMEALKEISKALSQCVGNVKMFEHMKSGDDPQRKVLAFINCVFECHNESLLTSPVTDMTANEYLQKNLEEELFFNLLIPLNSLTLINQPLLPLDCLSLGYYICTKSRVVSDNQLLLFSLNYCSIDNIGIRVFFNELKKNITQPTAARVILYLAGNKFDEETLLYLKNLVQGQSNIEGIALNNCFDPKNVDNCFALKCITEGLSNNSSCGFIDLSDNFITSSHIHYIILMLGVCHQIYYLDLSFYNLSRVMPLLSTAISLKISLESLFLTYCNISDSDLVLLGKMIPCYLRQLNVHGNPITSSGVSDFLELFVDNPRPRLELFYLELELSEEQKQTVEKINYFRYRMSDPREYLFVKSMMTSCSLPSIEAGNEVLEMTSEPCHH